jgi:hypothetical protein
LWYREENISGVRKRDIKKGMKMSRFKYLAEKNGLSCEIYRLRGH